MIRRFDLVTSSICAVHLFLNIFICHLSTSLAVKLMMIVGGRTRDSRKRRMIQFRKHKKIIRDCGDFFIFIFLFKTNEWNWIQIFYNPSRQCFSILINTLVLVRLERQLKKFLNQQEWKIGRMNIYLFIVRDFNFFTFSPRCHFLGLDFECLKKPKELILSGWWNFYVLWQRKNQLEPFSPSLKFSWIRQNH